MSWTPRSVVAVVTAARSSAPMGSSAAAAASARRSGSETRPTTSLASEGKFSKSSWSSRSWSLSTSSFLTSLSNCSFSSPTVSEVLTKVGPKANSPETLTIVTSTLDPAAFFGRAPRRSLPKGKNCLESSRPFLWFAGLLYELPVTGQLTMSRNQRPLTGHTAGVGGKSQRCKKLRYCFLTKSSSWACSINFSKCLISSAQLYVSDPHAQSEPSAKTMIITVTLSRLFLDKPIRTSSTARSPMSFSGSSRKTSRTKATASWLVTTSQRPSQARMQKVPSLNPVAS
mmetsp:Transcript_2713/g.6899  ORF Transcript_2713/g.6899 Transcript_2713/m.6899 type:complete len:285 (-) Transcript_2713:797-1651(-)